MLQALSPTVQRNYAITAKKDGLIIKECPTRSLKAKCNSLHNLDWFIYFQQFSTCPTKCDSFEMVKQMIISTFSAMGFSGKSSSPWYFDSRASNKIQFLNNTTKYFGNLKIHTVVGNQFPITTTVDIYTPLTNVFVSLVSLINNNLISIGQLVDNDCQVRFLKFGCLVQDLHSRTIIVKGPKIGCLFPHSIYMCLRVFLYLLFCDCNY